MLRLAIGSCVDALDEFYQELFATPVSWRLGSPSGSSLHSADLDGRYCGQDELFKEMTLPSKAASGGKVHVAGNMEIYNSMIELLQLLNYLLGSQASNSKHIGSMDVYQFRLKALQKQLANVRASVEQSSLPSKRGMLKYLDHRAQEVEEGCGEMETKILTTATAEKELIGAKLRLVNLVNADESIHISWALSDPLAAAAARLEPTSDPISLEHLRMIKDGIQEIQEELKKHHAGAEL